MTGQKTKPAVKRVTAIQPKTGKAVADKKAVAKKTVATATKPKNTTKSPVVKKTAAAVAKPKAPSTKTATTKSPVTANKTAAKPSPEERYRMVETAAYYIAEKHGFQGRSDEHWAAAERAIAIKLGQ